MKGYFLWLPLVLSCGSWAQDPQPLEKSYTPFDFDNYRRTPIQAKQESPSWTSKENQNLQRDLISGERQPKQRIGNEAASLFPDSRDIPLRREPEPLPTPNELTDEITTKTHGETSKGKRDLLTRGRVADELGLEEMSATDYEVYAAQWRSQQEEDSANPGKSLLRPMPTLMNSKTGGPPHAYAVSQAGVGARAEPRDNQNPFEDLIRFLRLDQPVTKGTDPLPSPSGRPNKTLPAAPVSSPSSPQETPSPAP